MIPLRATSRALKWERESALAPGYELLQHVLSTAASLRLPSLIKDGRKLFFLDAGASIQDGF